MRFSEALFPSAVRPAEIAQLRSIALGAPSTAGIMTAMNRGFACGEFCLRQNSAACKGKSGTENRSCLSYGHLMGFCFRAITISDMIREKNHSDEMIIHSQDLRRSAANLGNRIGEIANLKVHIRKTFKCEFLLARLRAKRFDMRSKGNKQLLTCKALRHGGESWKTESSRSAVNTAAADAK